MFNHYAPIGVITFTPREYCLDKDGQFDENVNAVIELHKIIHYLYWTYIDIAGWDLGM